MNKNTPAFPRPFSEDNYERYFSQEGMSLRDYFAAAVMTGFCASINKTNIDENVMARQSYEMADAMLKARGS